MRIFLLILSLPIYIIAAEPPTSETAIIGRFARGPFDTPVRVNAGKFDELFASKNPQNWSAEIQVRQFFRNGGSEIEVIRIDADLLLAQALMPSENIGRPRGLGWLPILSDLGLLLVPELAELPVSERNPLLEKIREFAASQHFTLILDPPKTAGTIDSIISWRDDLPDGLGFAVLYYPHIMVNPAAIGAGSGFSFPTGASGSVAARIAQKDAVSGIWENPAGPDATIQADGLTFLPSNFELDQLNSAHINVIRDLPSSGIVLWGARTLDKSNVENRYLSAVRTRRWILHNLQRTLTFAAFEENDSTLWTSLRSSAEAFLHNLYLRGAFAGATPEQSYFVLCDATTTSAVDIQNHRANLITGLALISPMTFYNDAISLQTLDLNRPPPLSQRFLGPPIGNELTVFYSTTPGFHFTMEQTVDLSGDFWLPGHRLSGDGSWNRVGIPLTGQQRFIRIRTD